MVIRLCLINIFVVILIIYKYKWLATYLSETRLNGALASGSADSEEMP